MIFLNYENDRSIKSVFDLLTNTSSTLTKKDILIKNSDNDLFRSYINYLLNPYLITGISAKKISKETEKSPTCFFDSFTGLMQYVLKNNTGSDEVITNIRHFLNAQDDEMRDFYISIITKNAKLGCDVKSVNKAFGTQFIPQWEVQQAYSIEKSPLKEGEWFSLSEKLNGVRGTYYDGKIFSRQGKEFTGLEHITFDIARIFPDSADLVLDGELVRKNIDGLSDNENFRIGTGLLGQDDADKSSIQFVVFDLLSKKEFANGKSVLTYKSRLSVLHDLANQINELHIASLKIVEVLYAGTDTSMIDFYLDKMVREDKEGLMLNRDSVYACKRHNGILKIKRFYTVDLKVIAVEEGSGRHIGRLGAFVVDYKGNTLNVGSGFSDLQRDEYWEMREKLIGRVIEVKYKEESSDKKTGQYSLQFPIFIALREEGKEESYD